MVIVSRCDFLYEWELVTAISGFIGLILAWSYNLYHRFIIEKEKNLNKKVEKEVLSRAKSFKKGKWVDIKDFVADLSDITEFGYMLDDAKEIFEKNLFYSGIAAIAFSILYAVTSTGMYVINGIEPQTLITLSGLSVIYCLWKMTQLEDSKNKIERYLKGEDIEEILYPSEE
jgi:hypothetical protein